MDESHYRSATTPGGKWGLALALLTGMPVMAFLLLVTSLGDCAGGTDACKPSALTHVVLPTIVVMLAVGLSARWLVNRLARRA